MLLRKIKKNANILFLLSLMIGMAIVLNILVAFMFYKNFSGFNKTSNQIMTIERQLNTFQMEIKRYHRNEYEHLKSLLDLEATVKNPKELNHRRLYEFPGYTAISNTQSAPILLEDLSHSSEEIHNVEKKALSWHRKYSMVFSDIQEDRSLNRVRNKIIDINSLLSSKEGVEKLEKAKLLRKLKDLDGQEYINLAKQYTKIASRSQSISLGLIQQELTDLSLLIEKLHSEKDGYNLSDLKDNKIKQSLSRILALTESLALDDRKASGIDQELMDELTELIFGKNYSFNNAHQAVILGEGGYFLLKQKLLKYRQERDALLQELIKLENVNNNYLQDLNKKVQHIKRVENERLKQAFSKAWNRMLAISAAFLTLFILISIYVYQQIKRQTQKEKRTQNEINNIIEGTGDAIRVIDTEGNIVRINSKMSEITGVSKEESVGRKCDQDFSGDNCHTENCPLKLVLERKTSIQTETLKEDKDGNKISYDMIAAPLKDGDKIVGVVESYRNISEYKKLQQQIMKTNRELLDNEEKLNETLLNLKTSHEKLRETQKQLIKSEKMASVGQLSAGVAHEINNPTGFVLNNLTVLIDNIATLFQTLDQTETLIKKHVADDDTNQIFYEKLKTTIHNEEIDFLKKDLPKLVDQSIEGAKRIQKIVKNLKNFTHPGKEEKKSTSINDQINKAIQLTNNEIKYNCEMIADLEELPIIHANAQQMEQVFINLILNASQAIEKSGHIKIHSYTKDSSIFVEVIDNGPGIPEENINEIFNPFFTTKDVGKGTGLGLSIVYGIIEDHNGEINVESASGKGTKFIISLPISA